MLFSLGVMLCLSAAKSFVPFPRGPPRREPRCAGYKPDGMSSAEWAALKAREKEMAGAKPPRTFFDRKTLRLEERSAAPAARRAMTDAEMWRTAGALTKSEVRRRGAAPKVQIGSEKPSRWRWPWEKRRS